MSEPSQERTIRIDSTEVSDTELAAITVAVGALTAGSTGAAGVRGRLGPGSPVAAWRAAALREGTGGQRVGSLTALRDARADRG